MKVLVLFQNTIPGQGGGIETYCHAIEELFQNDNNIDVTLSPLRPNAVPILRRKYHTDELREVISKVNPDIVHVNGTTSYGVIQGIKIAKELGKKVILTPHWHPFQYMRRPMLSKLFFYGMIKPSLKLVDAIVTINKEEYQFFSKLHNDVLMFPHWVRTRNSAILAQDKKRYTNTILFIGRLSESNKGIEHIYQIPENKYNIICVGKDEIPYRKDIKIAKNLSDEELNKLYSEASLVVVPSRYEAFSYVSLEALSHETPVVMSDRVRIADYIEDVKAIGIFKFQDFNDFNAKIDQTINSSFDKKKVLYPFSSEKARSNYSTLYLNTLRKK